MKAQTWVASAIALALGATGCKHSHDDSAHGHEGPAAAAPSAPTGPVTNPVQSEMRILNEVTRDWVTAIAQNQLDGIPAGIHKVHGAREVTDKALKDGKYKPPKAGTNVDDFIKQDEAFHDELVKLLTASKAKDLTATTKQLGVVLEGCTDCHTKYRF